MIYRTLALAGALSCALAAPPAEADPLADFFASFDPPAREARLHPSSAGWRRIRPAPMRAIEPNGSPLISVAQRYLGSGNFTGLRAPWCAAALRVARGSQPRARTGRAISPITAAPLICTPAQFSSGLITSGSTPATAG